MRKILLLAGIFTIFAYSQAKAEQYYENDGYYYHDEPRYVERVEYREPVRQGYRKAHYEYQSPRYLGNSRYQEAPRYEMIEQDRVVSYKKDNYRQYNNYAEVEKKNKIRPYIGLDIAKSTIGGMDLQYAYERSGYDDYFEDSFTSYSGVVGIKVNKNFGLEAFYQKSSEEDKDTSRRAYDYDNDIAIGSDETSTISYTAYGVDAMGYLPINQEFELLASLGIAQYNFESNAIAYAAATDGYNIVAQTFTNKKDFDSLGIRLGIGAQYNFNEHFALRAMARYIKMNDDEYIRSLTEFSLGLRYMF